MGYRLRKLRGNKSSADFASEIGISRTRLVGLETGRDQISRNVIERLSNMLPNMNINWLLTGQGSPTIQPAEPSPSASGGRLAHSPATPASPPVPQFAAPGPPTRLREFMSLLLQCPADVSDRLRGMPTVYIDGVVSMMRALVGPELTAPCEVIDGLYVGAGVDYDTGSQFAASQLQLPCPPFAQAHHYHLVTVRGDSMLGLVNDGDRVIVDLSITSPALCLNRPVVANLDPHRRQGEGATCKILERSTPTGLQLRPANPAVPVIPHIQPTQIIGLVVSILPRDKPGQ